APRLKLLELAAEDARGRFGAHAPVHQRTAQLAVTVRAFVEQPQDPELVFAADDAAETDRRAQLQLVGRLPRFGHFSHYPFCPYLQKRTIFALLYREKER